MRCSCVQLWGHSMLEQMRASCSATLTAELMLRAQCFGGASRAPTKAAVAPQAAAVELGTLATCERDETATQQARLERLQCARGRAQKQAHAATRFARAEEW